VDDPNLAILPSELGGIVADLLDHSRHAIAENDAVGEEATPAASALSAGGNTHR
jgi:hypothetical protein